MPELPMVPSALLFVYKFSVEKGKVFFCDVPVLLYEAAFRVLLCSDLLSPIPRFFVCID